MESWLTFVRWAHVLAAASWLGEVVVINFVLVPVLGHLDTGSRERFVDAVFPKIFRLASVLSTLTILTGLILALRFSGEHLDLFTTTAWGRAILAGGTMGLLLTAFHFVMESRLERSIASHRKNPGASVADDVLHRLRVIPRVGLVVLLVIFGLMMYAARGL
ncbi:MAG: hypothetical protein GEV06_18675 [Luteitalea sp.]|nr:hypothetical protein [Luteitalea sp.]